MGDCIQISHGTLITSDCRLLFFTWHLIFILYGSGCDIAGFFWPMETVVLHTDPSQLYCTNKQTDQKKWTTHLFLCASSSSLVWQWHKNETWCSAVALIKCLLCGSLPIVSWRQSDGDYKLLHAIFTPGYSVGFYEHRMEHLLFTRVFQSWKENSLHFALLFWFLIPVHPGFVWQALLNLEFSSDVVISSNTNTEHLNYTLKKSK